MFAVALATAPTFAYDPVMSDTPRQSSSFSGVRQAVLLGLFTGTGCGLGVLLSGVPNVELITLTSVLAGVALGPVGGLVAGALAEAAYSLASPYGVALPVLFVAQVVGMGLAGLVGGLTAPPLLRLLAQRRRLVTGVLAATLGAATTVVFDLLTNLAIGLATDIDLRVALAGGIVFALLHVGANSLVFGALWPLLAPRVRRLRAPSLRVQVVAWLALGVFACAAPGRAQLAPVLADSDTAIAVVDTAAAIAAMDTLGAVADTTRTFAGVDTTTAVPDTAAILVTTPPAVRTVRGWRRPLWEPFYSSLREDLARRSQWLAVADGGFGARVFLAGEPGTSFFPTVLRDGLPVLVGHRFLDDVESVPITGTRLGATTFGLDGWGGTDGVVRRNEADLRPDAAFTDTRWHAGSQQDLFRSVHLLTAVAPWRVGLDIEEHLNDEAYDFRTPGETRYSGLADAEVAGFPGRAKFRSGRGVLRRYLDLQTSLTVSVEDVRKLKNALPAFDATEQDLWRHTFAVDWREPGLRAAAYTIDEAVDWNRPASSGNPPPARKLEGGREGILLTLGDGLLRFTAERWTLADTGADTSWAPDDAGPVDGSGASTNLGAARAWTVGPARLAATAAARWDDGAGWAPEAAVHVASADSLPWWTVSLERGGRAPRSDERLTAWRFAAPERIDTVVLPGHGLARERTWRGVAALQRRVAGLDVALSAAYRRLEDGIGWRAQDGTRTGRWANGLDLRSHTIRAGLSREGRFLGWVRVQADAAWRGWTRDGDVRIALPPRQDWQVGVLWENHFFDEDGILQVGWFLDHRGEMDDPWYLARRIVLPATTQQDLVLGFRLVGTNLGIALLNLTDQRVLTSAGSLTDGRQMRWRLHWTFLF